MNWDWLTPQIVVSTMILFALWGIERAINNVQNRLADLFMEMKRRDER